MTAPLPTTEQRNPTEDARYYENVACQVLSLDVQV